MLAHGPTVEAEVRKVSDQEIEGMSLMKGTSRRKKDTPVYFVAQFSQPMTEFGGWKAGKLTEVSDVVQGKDVGAYARFKASYADPDESRYQLYFG